MASETPPVQAGSSSAEEPRISIEPRRRFPKHVQLDLSSRPDRPWGSGSSVQLRSYSQSPFRSYRSSGAVTPNSHFSPRASVSSINLQHLLEKLELDQYDTYGVEELRDGFFDASFFRPLHTVPGDQTTTVIPQRCPYYEEVARNTFSDVTDFWYTAFRTHQGFKVAKSFLAYLICYFLCLIPTVQTWLGNYSYFAPISVLLNHSGRSFGAQLDGLLQCVLGAAVGLGWGCIALELSVLIGPSNDRHEGLVEVFLIIFAAVMAAFRSTLVRLYQAFMSAGLAVFFLCLVDSEQVNGIQRKAREFAVPFLVGQAVCLIVNVIILPDAGGRDVAYVYSLQNVCV